MSFWNFNRYFYIGTADNTVEVAKKIGTGMIKGRTSLTHYKVHQQLLYWDLISFTLYMINLSQ